MGLAKGPRTYRLQDSLNNNNIDLKSFGQSEPTSKEEERTREETERRLGGLLREDREAGKGFDSGGLNPHRTARPFRQYNCKRTSHKIAPQTGKGVCECTEQ